MAATVRYWRAGGNDLNLAGNYHDGAYGASGVPAVSNIINFTEGMDRITANLTALTVSGFQYWAFTEGFGGFLGGNGSSATISCHTRGSGQYANETLEYAAGGGFAHIVAGTGGIDIVKCNTTGGHLFLNGGTINTRLEMVRGLCDVNDQVDLSGKTMEVWGGEIVVEYKADGTDPTINIFGGVTILRRPPGTITVNGGKVIVQVEKETAGAATLTINNGEVDWRAGAIGTGLNLNGGFLTFKNAIRPISLSAATIVAANTYIDRATAPGAKVTWPAVDAITLKGGMAAEAIMRNSAAAA